MYKEPTGFTPPTEPTESADVPDKNQQEESTDSFESFDDGWGDLGAELKEGDTEDENSVFDEKLKQEQHRQEVELKENREAIGAMATAEAGLQVALMQEGREIAPGELNDLREAKVEGFDEIDPEDRAVNAVFIARLQSKEGEAFDVAYKPEGGEIARFDTSGDKEPRMRKEWLGYQIDQVFDVGRAPKAIVREGGLSEGIGSISEWRPGKNAAKFERWQDEVSPEELRRVADFHYLTGETDGRDGQFIIEPDGRLTTIDRGESFSGDNEAPLYSEAISEALDKGYEASPEVLAAAQSFLESEGLQKAVADAFNATFGEKEGPKRVAAMVERVKSYVEKGGIPKDINLVRKEAE